MTESQGKRASKHGMKHRDSTAGVLIAHGWEDVGRPDCCNPNRHNILEEFMRHRLGQMTPPALAFAAEVPICNSILGMEYKANFLLLADTWPAPVALMVRTQESGGTALDKYEHMYANIVERFPCPSLVLLSLTPSETLSASVIEAVYLRADEWVGRSRGRIARVFRGLDCFRRWLSDYAPYPPETVQPLLV